MLHSVIWLAVSSIHQNWKTNRKWVKWVKSFKLNSCTTKLFEYILILFGCYPSPLAHAALITQEVNLSVADISPFSLRISFPIAIAILPLESILSLTLFGVLNQNASGSPDSNKQRKAPELLGKVSTPLFDFRRWVEQRIHNKQKKLCVLGVWKV